MIYARSVPTEGEELNPCFGIGSGDQRPDRMQLKTSSLRLRRAPCHATTLAPSHALTQPSHTSVRNCSTASVKAIADLSS
jgi:hypothetical protein